VLRIIQVLYQRKPTPYQTLNFHVGTEQPTHSDTIHFQSVPKGFMCGVWIAFEDIDAENGPLHYYPGSHRLPAFEPVDFGIRPTFDGQPADIEQTYNSHYEPFIAALAKACGIDKINLNLKKGQALIWSANLLHGGSPIRDTSRTRNSQVTHYFFDDCFYYQPRVSDILLGRPTLIPFKDIQTGAPVRSTYYGLPLRTTASDGIMVAKGGRLYTAAATVMPSRMRRARNLIKRALYALREPLAKE
jgi:ectoine hydroxylase-related dioxygenase (phytanoyl-CoA dioxygenase family)